MLPGRRTGDRRQRAPDYEEVVLAPLARDGEAPRIAFVVTRAGVEVRPVGRGT